MSNRIRKTVTLLLFFLLPLTSCTKTARYSGTVQKISALKSRATIIVLHEDYIFVEPAAIAFKNQLLTKLRQRLSKTNKYQLQFIASGGQLPKNNSNNSMIFLTGDIWFHKGNTEGYEKVKVKRSSSGYGYTKSWEEMETRNWKQTSLQTIISLYFIEIGEDTKLLRATVTASNDKNQVVFSGSRKISDNQYSRFYVDKNIEPGHQLIKSSSSIHDLRKSFEDLADKALNIHLQAI